LRVIGETFYTIRSGAVEIDIINRDFVVVRNY